MGEDCLTADLGAILGADKQHLKEALAEIQESATRGRPAGRKWGVQLQGPASTLDHDSALRLIHAQVQGQVRLGAQQEGSKVYGCQARQLLVRPLQAVGSAVEESGTPALGGSRPAVVPVTRSPHFDIHAN
jgi:hypothetical protein